MLSYEQALDRVLQFETPVLETESVALRGILNRVIAEGQISSIDVPPFANSAMDGYALNAENFDGSQSYQVSQRIIAGSSAELLESGTIARIFTGAPVPLGANAVVIQEHASIASDGRVSLSGPVRLNQNIRPAGDDIKKNDVLIPAATVVNTRGVGLLANAGIAKATCYKPLRVALLATGNEIRNPGESLAFGQIYNSNYYLLRAELELLGAEIVECGSCGDNASQTFQALDRASKEADAVITIGGMSVGEEDHVREQASKFGDLDFWKVAIKPGKPLGFGRIGEALFFGLPGNPVSAFVTFFLFAKPALKKAMGIHFFRNLSSRAKAGFEYTNKGARTEFIRVKLETDGWGEPLAKNYRTQSSGVLASLTFADALVMLEPGQVVASGDSLKTYTL